MSDVKVEIEPLNEPQKEAVAHAHGPLIVFAGAGSGKTRVITYRIANLVATHDVPPYRILAVTFTNKAAGEMRHRLERLLGDEMTRELWIGTFHAVCVRLLRRYHEAIGIDRRFTIYDEADQRAVMKRVMKELDLDERRVAPQRILARIEQEKQEARGPEEFEERDWMDELIGKAYVAYERHLRKANAVDFADLLLITLRFAEKQNDESAEHLRKRFSHILVDEFQDTNLVQYRLVRALAGDRRNICVVGDDDQSIYRWRGADIRNIRGFTTDFRDAKLIKLEQNYRSSKNIVGAALGVIRHSAERTPKELWTANDDGARVKIVHSANERDEATYVAEGVVRQIEAGVSPRDMAVFYRVHAQSRVLEEMMRRADVPYQIIGGTRFFDRAEVKDVLAYLRVVANPQSDVDLLRIINKPPRRIGKKVVEDLSALAQREQSSLYDALPALASSGALAKGARTSLTAFRDMIERARAKTADPEASVSTLSRDLVAESGYVEWLQGQDTAEADSRVETIAELLGSIQEYENDLADTDESPALEEYLTRVTLVTDADTVKDTPRLAMMTIHAAKGLEFDTVYLTGLEEGLFPLRGNEPGQEDELEEERRLAYVAITRARKNLEITHVATRMIYGQTRYNGPSRFLADVPPRHQERAATGAMHQMSREFTRGNTPTWRDVVRAGSPAPAPRTPIREEPPPRPAGERYIERDDDDGDEVSLRVGMNVRHPRFGVGKVSSIDRGHDPSVTVRFDEGPRRIKMRFLSPV